MAFPFAPPGHLRMHREPIRWVLIVGFYALFILQAINDRITPVDRVILLAAHLLAVVVLIGLAVEAGDGKGRGRNVFTAGRGSGSFLGFVFLFAFAVGLGLFDLDIVSPAAPIIAAAVIGVAGITWYLIDRRTIRRDGPFGIQAVPQAAGWYADPWQLVQWRWDGLAWTGYTQ